MSHAWNGVRDWAYELRMLLQNFTFGTSWTNGKLLKNAMQKCIGGGGSLCSCAGNSFKEGNVIKRQCCILIWENVGTKLFWHLRLGSTLSRDVLTEFHCMLMWKEQKQWETNLNYLRHFFAGILPYLVLWYMILYICYLQLGCHLVAVVQYTFTHKQYIEWHK